MNATLLWLKGLPTTMIGRKDTLPALRTAVKCSRSTLILMNTENRVSTKTLPCATPTRTL